MTTSRRCQSSSIDKDATHKSSSALFKLLQQQATPEVDIDCFNGNPLNYNYFMALFCKAVETKIEDPRDRLTRLLKHTVGEAKSLLNTASSYLMYVRVIIMPNNCWKMQMVFVSVRVYQIINIGFHWTLLKYYAC